LNFPHTRPNSRAAFGKLTLFACLSFMVFSGAVFGAAAGAAADSVIPPGAQLAPPAAQSAVQQMPSINIPQTTESIDKVRRLEAEGEKFFESSLVEKALTKWQEAYAMSIEMKYADGEGRALTNMSRVYLDRGDWIKAKYLGENALEVLGGGSDKKGLGKARVALAQAYFGLSQNDLAGEQLGEAIKSFTNEEAGDAIEAAKLLQLSGQLLVRYGKLREAIQFFQQAGSYYLQGNDPINAVRLHITVASILEQSGTYTAALEESQKAADISASQVKPNYQLTVAALSSLGNSQYCLGEYSKARATYENALTTAGKMPPKDFTLVSRATLDLGYGHCLLATGDYDLARQYFERCLPVFKSNNMSTGAAQTYNGLGLVHEYLGNRSKAINYLQQALELQQLVRPPQTRLHIAVLQNLAFVESRNGAARDARTHLQAALPYFQNGPKAADTIESLRLLEARNYAALGEIYYKLSDAQQADASLKKAISVATSINDDASLWRDYVNLARLQISQSDTGGAKESLASALSFFRSPQAGAFVSSERLAFVSNHDDLGHVMVGLLARLGMGAEALLASEQLKEDLFCSNFIRRGGAVKADDRDVYNDLSNLKTHLRAAESFDLPVKLVKEWQAWLQRFKTLTAQNRSLARLIGPVPNHVADMVKAVQAAKATFVEFSVGPESTTVFTLDASGRLSATVVPVNSKQLQTQVSSLLALGTAAGESGQQSQSSIQKERSILQSLFTELFPPAVRAAIPKGPEQTICIVPDGVLYNLPFASLVDDNGKYFIETHTLTTTASMGALTDVPAKYVSDNTVLIANAYQLPEADSIASAIPAGDVLRLNGKDADLAELRDQGRGKSALHFTGRMSVLANNAFNTVIPLYPPKKVTADSLFSTSLSNDLAVFGDCSINPRDTMGTSVVTFGRGLNYAGVRNMLLGFWQPSDAARVALLQDFYKQKVSGQSNAQALRKAELSAIARDPAPHSWAAFQLIGPGY
jgi:tetratricopeptide (TPR) repeat protein/CHAT domain-containing protein